MKHSLTTSQQMLLCESCSKPESMRFSCQCQLFVPDWGCLDGGGGDFGSSMQMGWAIQDKEFGAKPIELIELTGSSLAQVVVKG